MLQGSSDFGLGDLGSRLREGIADFLKPAAPVQSDTLARRSFSELQPLDVTPGAQSLGGLPDAAPSAPEVIQKAEAGGFSPGQKLVATTAADAALGLGLGLASLEQQEDDAFEQMSAEFGFRKEQLQRNANLSQTVSQVAELNNILASVRGVERQADTGSVQQQQFFRNPQTGARLDG